MVRNRSDFEDDNKTIFSTGMNGEEKDAIKSGENRGKRAYEKANPKCGLVKTTDQYRKNYERCFRHG